MYFMDTSRGFQIFCLLKAASVQALWKKKSDKGLNFKKKIINLEDEVVFILCSKDTSPAAVCIDSNTDYSAESY